MRGAIAFCFALLAMCAAMCAQNGSSDSDNSGRIMALESAWNQAEVEHDNKAMSLLLADSFQYTDFDGTFMNKNNGSRWSEKVSISTRSWATAGCSFTSTET
jgi:hypothetical protein